MYSCKNYSKTRLVCEKMLKKKEKWVRKKKSFAVHSANRQVGIAGSPNRLHRIHDGPHDKHLPRHTHERHRIPSRRLHSVKIEHKTQNSAQQTRYTQRNHTRLGTKPRRNPHQRGTLSTSPNHNRPQSTRAVATDTTRRSVKASVA